jgi:hypothetical protein
LLVDRNWSTWNRGKPISPYQLASLLRPYGVKSRDIRDGEDRFWGYRRDGFEDAFRRYLPRLLADVGLSKPGHPTSLEKQEVAGLENPTSGECRDSKTTKNPNNPAGCRVVGNPINAMEGRTDATHVEEASPATGSSENRKIQAGSGTMKAPGAAREMQKPPDEGETEAGRDRQRWTLRMPVRRRRTMTPFETLSEAARHRVRLEAEGDDLVASAAVKPPEPLFDALRANTPAIIAIVRARAAANHAMRAPPPPNCDDKRWSAAVEGLRAFIEKGWSDIASALGWTPEELFCVPPTWSRVDLTGAALLLEGKSVVAVTTDSIVIETPSGARQGFYRASRARIA